MSKTTSDDDDDDNVLLYDSDSLASYCQVYYTTSTSTPPPTPASTPIASSSSSFSCSKLKLRDWNEEYQQLIVRYQRFLCQKESQEDECRTVVGSLCRLVQDFNYTCKVYGRLLVSELSLLASQTTINRSDSARGVVSGDKYVFHSIFFKLAGNDAGLFDADSSAMKAAALDLLSMSHCLDAALDMGVADRLFFPLTAVLELSWLSIELFRVAADCALRDACLWQRDDG
jgi:Clustered mitochondria